MGRTFTLLLGFLVPFWVLSQHETTHLLELTGPTDHVLTKTLHAKVLALDPHALVSFHERLIKVRADENITAASLIQVLNSDGDLVRFMADPSALSTRTVATGPQAVGMPPDPGQQEAEIRAAKAAWLLANPGMYQRPSRANSQPHE